MFSSRARQHIPDRDPSRASHPPEPRPGPRDRGDPTGRPQPKIRRLQTGTIPGVVAVSSARSRCKTWGKKAERTSIRPSSSQPARRPKPQGVVRMGGLVSRCGPRPAPSPAVRRKSLPHDRHRLSFPASNQRCGNGGWLSMAGRKISGRGLSGGRRVPKSYYGAEER